MSALTHRLLAQRHPLEVARLRAISHRDPFVDALVARSAALAAATDAAERFAAAVSPTPSISNARHD